MSKTTRTLLATVLLGALAAPALAQDGNPMASTQYPPSAGSSEGLAQPLNSLPRTAATAVRSRPGSDIETTVTGPAATASLARDAADAPAG